ncbi:hypothetical protein LXL04_016518 [Taraxacum kok-saghyz]
MGDPVYIKLQSYRQHLLAKRPNETYLPISMVPFWFYIISLTASIWGGAHLSGGCQITPIQPSMGWNGVVLTLVVDVKSLQYNHLWGGTVATQNFLLKTLTTVNWLIRATMEEIDIVCRYGKHYFIYGAIPLNNGNISIHNSQMDIRRSSPFYCSMMESLHRFPEESALRESKLAWTYKIAAHSQFMT